jgi:hypothetical protein
LKRIRARRNGVVFDQPGNALAADATAASTSASLAKSTRPVWAPVAGSKTGPERPALSDVRRPSMKCPMVLGVAGALAAVIAELLAVRAWVGGPSAFVGNGAAPRRCRRCGGAR